ncbi:hypothetical protein M0D68_14305 [Paraburkholderia sp. SEWSISQ10-3 4]|uniref:hypothetical protein n=1 Tax=Paraburkholderia TaxID=1822464 RepID=UPI00224F4896|nr:MULTISPECIES: hypothetical protein [Paraburkholderia]MCX4139363.1 hypothetical protein [Paraburkholderia aspalathi]MDN7172051.1 hypothetical protein [Paraburkholderia sp. SEWSISQ10-3 4]MDQ6501690.1 hypothetical protein [Paraburkholderia aspalathi]
MPKENEILALTEVSKPLRASCLVPVTFRDMAFRMRTLVFADGSTLAVEKSLVMASTPEHVAALERHPEFERASDGS